MSTIPARVALRSCACILRDRDDCERAGDLDCLAKDVGSRPTFEAELAGFLAAWAYGWHKALDEIRYFVETAEHPRAAEIADATRADLVKVCRWLLES